MMEFLFYIPGIACGTCVARVGSILQELPNIESFSVDLVNKKLIVKAFADVREVVINKLSQYKCREILPAADNPLQQEAASTITEEEYQRNQRAKQKRHWILGGIGTACGLAMLILPLVITVIPPVLMSALAAGSVLLTGYLGYESYLQAFDDVYELRGLTMDALFALSALTVIGVSIAAFFVPWLPMMFEAGLLIFGINHLGEAIKSSIMSKIPTPIKFKARAPKQVNVLIDGKRQTIPITQVKPGDSLYLEAGEIIPVDGVCEQAIDIHDDIATGVFLSRKAEPGESLRAGMRLAKDAAAVSLLVSKSFDESNLARLDEQIERAANNKVPLVESITQWLRYFVPLVIVIAILSGLTVGYFFNLAAGIQCAVAVLTSACPCTLGLIVPFATNVGMKKAEEEGVIFSSHEAVEKLNKHKACKKKAVVFDINGTSTKGSADVKHHDCYLTGEEKEEFFTYFFLLEESAVHPMARAICAYIRSNHKPSIPNDRSKWNIQCLTSESVGQRAIINGKQFYTGNQKMMTDNGIDISSSPTPAEGDNIVYLAREKELIGIITLQNTLLHDAPQAVSLLKNSNFDVYICTAADSDTANGIAQLCGISLSNVRADCANSPGSEEDKKSCFIKELRRDYGFIAMVGDADNDVLAFNQSDAAFAIQSEGKKIPPHVDVVIQHGSLTRVLTALLIAEQTITTVEQILSISFGYNIIAMLISGGLSLSVGMIVNPGAGAAFMVLQSILVLSWVAYLRYQPIKYPEKKSEKEPETLITENLNESYARSMNHLPKINNIQNTPINPTALTTGTSRSASFMHDNDEKVDDHQSLSSSHSLDPCR